MVSFTPLPEQDIIDYLRKQTAIDEQTARSIAEVSEGSLATALSMINEDMSEVTALWHQLNSGGIPSVDVLEISKEHTKNIPELLADFLALAKKDFRSHPRKMAPVIEEILIAQKLLEKNANAQMVADVLLLKLNRLATRSSF
jgi:hypothetical protein